MALSPKKSSPRSSHAAALWQISIETIEEAEEAVADLLERLYGEPASIVASAERDHRLVSVYARRFSGPRLPKRQALEAGLRHIESCGLDLGRARFHFQRLSRQDWSESWKKYFKIIEVGPALLIKPSWSKRRARAGQAVVVLDPGLSFGTGQHPTTAFCLGQLVRYHKRGQTRSFLDIGTGSGILAIAAAKLGFSLVQAFDNDPQAVRVARSNAIRNRVQHRIKIQSRDLKKLPFRAGRFDLVCANLLDDLLISEARRIAARLKPDGVLVLAGILAQQFQRVRNAFERLGFKLLETHVEREWQSGAFQRPAKK